MVIRKQDFHLRCFIDTSAPLRLGCSGLGRGYAEKKLPGIRDFFDSHYTRGGPQPRLEISIGQIRFSDSLSIRLFGKVPAVFRPYPGRPYLTPPFSPRLFLPPGAAIV
jgi:hypothetical protein